MCKDWPTLNWRSQASPHIRPPPQSNRPSALGFKPPSPHPLKFKTYFDQHRYMLFGSAFSISVISLRRLLAPPFKSLTKIYNSWAYRRQSTILLIELPRNIKTACLLLEHLHSVNKVNFGLKIAKLKKIKSILSLVNF